MPRTKKNGPVDSTSLDIDYDAIAQRAQEIAQETDQSIIDRLRSRFDILTDMTKAVKSGVVRAMIVSGPPGVGKSFGVENVLERQELLNKMVNRPPKFEIVKGSMSPLGLYTKLYEFSKENCVLVFDDCDSVLFDELSLNLLKAALDSSDTRTIAWNTDSRLLRSEDIPNKFEFKGAAIFITNIKFHHVRGKKIRAHLDALESRCHYIDLEMDTAREKLLWIKTVIHEKKMLENRDLDRDQQNDVIEYITRNQNHLRELSLRMALKIGDLRKAFEDNWELLADNTCLRRG